MSLKNIPVQRNDLAVGDSTSEKIRWIRKRAFYNRRNSLSCVKWGGSGHMGGAMSCAEILATLYYWVAYHSPADSSLVNRDRVVLSKGHASPMLYATLADAGYFPESELKTFRQINSRLQGHPEFGTPGIEVPSGSLGLGLSAAFGIALGLKYRGTDERVFAIVGDGELQEGLCWEVIMAAGSMNPGNFFMIIDNNGIQQDGFIADSIPIEPLEPKLESFGWAALRCDGHDVLSLLHSFSQAFSCKNKPVAIIADTRKGYGVSFMDNVPKWHGTAPPSDELYELAIRELREREEHII